MTGEGAAMPQTYTVVAAAPYPRHRDSHITWPCFSAWPPKSEPAADKPSETKAFPQPSSAPYLRLGTMSVGAP